MATLYEISDQYAAFLSAVESGDIPEEAINDTLESIQGEFQDKADNIACMIKNLEAEANAMKCERDTLSERIKSKQNQAERLKEYLSREMQKVGVRKFETARNAISFRKSTSCEIADEEKFKQEHPDLCKEKTVVSISKSDVMKRLKAGEAISGAELVVKQNLQIR
jgi:hypothetical protein